MPDSVTKEERDTTTTLLVESDLQSLCNAVLAGVVETSEEEHETLALARRIALTKSLDDTP